MGIVKRQSIKFSIVSYFSLFLGTINVLFIYPFALKPEELGLVRFVFETAMIIMPFLSLGFGNVAIKYFPSFKNPINTHNGFLFIIYIIPLIAFVLFVLLAFLFKANVFEFYTAKNKLFAEGLLFILPLTGLILLSHLSQSYCYNFQRIVVPNILNNLLIKITLPVLALLYFFDVISLMQVIVGMVGTYFVVLTGFILYLKVLGQFSIKPLLSFLTKPKIKEISTYSFYGILSGVGSVLALRIDTFMIASIVDLNTTGVYTIAVFIAGVISVPFKAISNISTSIISKAWAESDVATIDEIYKKSSLILLITGGYLLLLIWINIDDFFKIMPNGNLYVAGKYVVLILGIAKLIDITAGLNDHIINYSKYFRFNFYAIVVLAVLNLVMNFILIPKYQMIGAAFATLISITVFNMVKLVFIKLKVEIVPVSIKTVYVILIGFATYFILSIIPPFANIFVNVIIKSTLISIIFIGSVFYLKISEDFNDVVIKLFNRVRNLI